MKTLTQTSARLFNAPKASLIAAAVATSILLTACGGGSVNDAFDTASTANAASRSTSFVITSPSANQTVTVKGTVGSAWTSVSVVDMTTSNKVARDAVPSSGSFTTNVDTTRQINANHTWRITATNKNMGATSVQNIVVTVSNSKTGGTTTPSTPTTPTTSSIFYGANGHNNEGDAYDISSAALQLQQLQDLGVKLYRNEVYKRGVQTRCTVSTRRRTSRTSSRRWPPAA